MRQDRIKPAIKISGKTYFKRLFKWSAMVLASITIIAFIVDKAYSQSRTTLNQTIRAQLIREGKAKQFIKTTQGTMHVRVLGAKDGPVILLVHGGVVGGYAFENWQKPLIEAGYRIIIPDLLGYGYSDRPKVKYTKAFYIQQLKEVLDSLKIIDHINIIGASQGGGITLAFASNYPDRIKTVGLIAPNGGGDIQVVNRFLRTPVIGDFIFKNFGAKVMYNMISKSYEGNPAREGMLNWMKEQGKYKGYGEGVLNSVRNTLVNKSISWQTDAMDVIAKAKIPTFAAWGDKDKTVPYIQSEVFKSHIPQFQLFTVTGKDHAIAFGQADAILSQYIPFLNKNNNM